jgi:hypothetical protein
LSQATQQLEIDRFSPEKDDRVKVLAERLSRPLERLTLVGVVERSNRAGSGRREPVRGARADPLTRRSTRAQDR